MSLTSIFAANEKSVMKAIYSIGTNTTEENNKDIIDFLYDINVLENNHSPILSIEGIQIYRCFYILNEKEIGEGILSKLLLKHPVINLIGQVFYGRGKVEKEQVWNLLLHHKVVNERVTIDKLGQLFSFLNKYKIVTFDKRNNCITINKGLHEYDLINDYFIDETTPFTNITNIRRVIRNAKGCFYWLDKHFRKEGIEILIDSIEGDKVKSVIIISGDQNVTQSAKSDFRRAVTELSYRNITLEWRTCVDGNFLSKWHDRWLIADNYCYNIPPVLAIIRGQQSEILKTDNCPNVREYLTNSNAIS